MWHALCNRAFWPSVCSRTSLIKCTWDPRLGSLLFLCPATPVPLPVSLRLWRESPEVAGLAGFRAFPDRADNPFCTSVLQEALSGALLYPQPFPLEPRRTHVAQMCWAVWTALFLGAFKSHTSIHFYFLDFYYLYYTFIQTYFLLGTQNLTFISGSFFIFLQFISWVLSYIIPNVTQLILYFLRFLCFYTFLISMQLFLINTKIPCYIFSFAAGFLQLLLSAMEFWGSGSCFCFIVHLVYFSLGQTLKYNFYHR